jgi:hypothetical protein
MNIIIIKIAEVFTKFPGTRFRKEGKHSGEEFYEDILKPKLNELWDDPDKALLIDFDGTLGFPSSFISQVILYVKKDFEDIEVIKKKLKFKTDDEPLLQDFIAEKIKEDDTE